MHKKLFTAALAFFLIATACNDQATIEQLPTYVDVIDVKDSTLPTKNLTELTKDQNSLIFFYRADCPFCKEQLTYYIGKYDHINNFQIILASIGNTAEAINFQQELGIDTLSKFKHVIDKNQDLWKYAGATGVPYNIIVNKQQEIALRQGGILTIGTVENVLH
jgi:peroxiredoxin